MQPSEHDICRAAFLLVGMYGDAALDYARVQRNLEQDAESHHVWTRIMRRINQAMTLLDRPIMQ